MYICSEKTFFLVKQNFIKPKAKESTARPLQIIAQLPGLQSHKLQTNNKTCRNHKGKKIKTQTLQIKEKETQETHEETAKRHFNNLNDKNKTGDERSK